MRANLEKCHVILSSNTQTEIFFANGSKKFFRNEKLLRMTLDSELN